MPRGGRWSTGPRLPVVFQAVLRQVLACGARRAHIERSNQFAQQPSCARARTGRTPRGTFYDLRTPCPRKARGAESDCKLTHAWSPWGRPVHARSLGRLSGVIASPTPWQGMWWMVRECVRCGGPSRLRSRRWPTHAQAQRVHCRAGGGRAKRGRWLRARRSLPTSRCRCSLCGDSAVLAPAWASPCAVVRHDSRASGPGGLAAAQSRDQPSSCSMISRACARLVTYVRCTAPRWP